VITASATDANLVVTIGAREGDLAPVNVNVPRMGAVNASWAVDLTKYADATGEVVLQVSASAGKTASAADIALPLVIRLIVGHWDCFSRGALNDANSGCAEGKCNLCATPKGL
jgi:hypothetical protein